MKEILVILSLHLVLLPCDALKCLQCVSSTTSEDADCVEGNLSKSKNCEDDADGCLVMYKDIGDLYDRSCCIGDDECLNEVKNGIWVESCKTDNCNTMDPRNGSSQVNFFWAVLMVTVQAHFIL